MTATHILVLLATGVGVGFASGLLGVGGSFIMFPVMCWVTEAVGFPDIAVKVALGTGLLVILPTAMSGAWRHNKKRAVLWKAALILGLCGAVGAIAGATIAACLPEPVLKVGFGGLVLAAAVWMGVGKARILQPDGEVRELEIKTSSLAACGFPVGLIGGLTGIGGGVLLVPVMILAFGFPMHLAVGTSTAAIMFISLGGIIGYVVNGIGVSGLVPHSIGYVNIPMWLCLAATSIPMAQVGARAAHALPARQLSYGFVALMLYVGLKLIGVFVWL